MKKQIIPFIIIIALLVSGLAFGIYKYAALSKDLDAQVLASKDRENQLTQALSEREKEISDLSEALSSEKERNDDFEDQIDDLEDDLGIVQKIQHTDSELLEKYSKVFFLNENYIPAGLSDIDETYAFQKEKDLEFHKQGIKFLEDLLDDAADEGINLKVASAYRSFGTQAALKTGYTVTYGSGANAFSADQGYSEHQLGTAVDLIDPAQGALITTFDQTKDYEWLSKNAYKYGFILSYPKGNSYYQYEPWHWRFVGKKLAKYLHGQGINFYDMDQREIDKYLVNLFD